MALDAKKPPADKETVREFIIQELEKLHRSMWRTNDGDRAFHVFNECQAFFKNCGADTVQLLKEGRPKDDTSKDQGNDVT